MTILLIAASVLAACTVAYAAYIVGWTRGFVKGREQGMNRASKSVDVAPAPED